MAQPPIVVDWHDSGKPDLAVGTGATRTERRLAWSAAVLGVAASLALWLTHRLPWHGWQVAVAAFLAFDVAGGVVANTLNSGRRFYHSPARPGDATYVKLLKNELFFSALHIHPPVAALAFPDGRLAVGACWYALLQISTVTVFLAPVYLKRPVAFLLIAIAIVLNAYCLPLPRALAWLVPLLFLKIVSGHNVREERYRPASEAGPVTP